MIFMTHETAKGDNKIYEKMDKRLHIHSMFDIFCKLCMGRGQP